jgi:hypothetical protein
LVIAWILSEGASHDNLVVVHSRPIISSDADEAWQRFKDGGAIDSFIAIVFLDEQLDSHDCDLGSKQRLYVGAI